MKIKLIKITPAPSCFDWSISVSDVPGEYENSSAPHPGGWYYCDDTIPDDQAISTLIAAMIPPIQEKIAKDLDYLKALQSHHHKFTNP